MNDRTRQYRSVLSEAELAFWSGDDAVAAYDSQIELEIILGPARGVLGALDDRIRTVGKVEATSCFW